MTRLRLDLQTATERDDAVDDSAEATFGRLSLGEPAAVVGDLEDDSFLLAVHRNRRLGTGARVSSSILQRLQAAEVHGRHDFQVPSGTHVRVDAGDDSRVRCGGPQRDDKPACIQERWVDLRCEPAQPVEGNPRVSSDLVEEHTGRIRVRRAELTCELEVDDKRDEFLLHAVVKLPLERAAFRIRGGDQTRSA